MPGRRGWWAASALIAIMVLPALAGSASAASSYSWTLACKVSGTGYGSASVSWDWLQDGVVITGAGGTGSCGGSGGGTRPASANGITATLSVQACVLYNPCTYNSVSGNQSFDPSGSFKFSLKASASASGEVLGGGGGKHLTQQEHFSIDAAFTVTG